MDGGKEREREMEGDEERKMDRERAGQRQKAEEREREKSKERGTARERERDGEGELGNRVSYCCTCPQCSLSPPGPEWFSLDSESKLYNSQPLGTWSCTEHTVQASVTHRIIIMICVKRRNLEGVTCTFEHSDLPDPLKR